jgi:DNA-binding CsgD family transcriptional regulator/tetratricopeptide (TPR) repeat protein
VNSSSALVGRDREMELLRSALAAALDGRAQLVLLSGEPGIGKSTLMAAVADEAGAGGCRVSWVRAPETAGAPPYWLWTETLRGNTTRLPPDRQRSPLLPRPVLARILPELAGRFGEPSAPPPDASEAERFLLAHEVASLLVSKAHDSGWVIVLDDLHAADASSLEVIAHVAGTLASGRLLILGAYRDAAADMSPGLRSMLAQVSRHEDTLRIPLTGFDVALVQRQLSAIIGREAGAELATTVHARTGGNPFFTAEVARLIAHQGADPAGVSSVPPRLRDVITWRLDRLPAATREVLDSAAVIGKEVPLDVLNAACGQPPTAVLAALEPAVRAGVIRKGPSPTWIGFVHGLVAETVAAALSIGRAAALHEEVAAAIEATRAGAIEDWLPALARHWSAATPGERSSQRTVEVARRAAMQAEQRLAFADARELWRLALDAADGAAASPATRAELQLGLARALFRTGDVAAALDACLAAAAHAEGGGRPDLAAAAALVVEGVSEPQWAALLIGLAEGALRRLPSDGLALRARLHAQIAQLLHLAVTDSEEREQAEAARALQLGDSSGDDQALQAALRARQFVLSGPLDADQRLDNAARMIRMARTSGDPWPELWGRLWSVDALVQVGRLQAAEAELDELSSVVERLRWPVARWHVLRSRATVLQARGRFDAALDLANRALDELSGSGLERATLTHAAFLEGHAEAVGDLPGGDQRLRQLRQAAAREPGVLMWVATSLVRQGADEEARLLHARLPSLDQWTTPRYVLLVALRMRLEIALALGLRDEVEQLDARLRPVAHRHVAAGSGTFITFGSGLRYTGRAAAFLGDLDRAVVELGDAADDNARCGALTASVVARQELAEVLVRRNAGTDLDRARRLASSVLDDAGRLGMRPWAARASELLRGMPRRRLKSDELTAREVEVARLVAAGLTNRQVAVRLGISERTVENHLDHIFGKLAVGSRAQVAAWVAGGGGSALR